MEQLDKALDNLKVAILSRPPDKQQILIAWMNKWAKLLRKEDSFAPKYLPYYKRGDIVYVDFGFNVGAECGGIHYAVVMEANNNKGSGNVLVVPLTSHTPEKRVYKNDVLLGDEIITWTEKAGTVAKPNQIRAISKMRIIKPVRVGDKLARLNGKQLQLIDDQLKGLLRLGLDK